MADTTPNTTQLSAFGHVILTAMNAVLIVAGLTAGKTSFDQMAKNNDLQVEHAKLQSSDSTLKEQNEKLLARIGQQPVQPLPQPTPQPTPSPPGNGIVTFGYCPTCNAPGVKRSTNGFDTCANGHVYLAREALMYPRTRIGSAGSTGPIGSAGPDKDSKDFKDNPSK